MEGKPWPQTQVWVHWPVRWRGESSVTPSLSQQIAESWLTTLPETTQSLSSDISVIPLQFTRAYYCFALFDVLPTLRELMKGEKKRRNMSFNFLIIFLKMLRASALISLSACCYRFYLKNNTGKKGFNLTSLNCWGMKTMQSWQWKARFFSQSNLNTTQNSSLPKFPFKLGYQRLFFFLEAWVDAISVSSMSKDL